MSSQSYILTYFNENIQTQWKGIHDAMWDSGKIQYIGSQLEICPKSKKLHWQAFVRFHKQTKQRYSWFKQFAHGIHCEKCAKERAEAINYGIKEDTRVEGPKENGVKPEAVKKFDAEECKELIMQGKVKDIPFSYILRYNLETRINGIKEFYELDERAELPTFLPNPWGLLIPSRKQCKRRHYWIFSRNPNKGKTYHFALPTSKSYQAEIICGDTTYWNVTLRTQCLLFDEFNTAKYKWDTLNSMCDGTFIFRRMRQCSINLNQPLIIILSNQSISELYPHMNVFLYERFNEKELI